MSSWHSYPKVWNLGHKAVVDIFADPVLVEEKIDGSQCSFGKFGGELKIRSKGQEMNPAAPDKMFLEAVASVKERYPILHDGWTYRAEYLRVPHHNSLTYSRVPLGHLILFDINTDEETYLPYEALLGEADRIKLEAVPAFTGTITKTADLQELLGVVSCLGGTTVEGVVCKNYARFGPDKKALMAKFVSEKFKEINTKNWQKDSRGDIMRMLGEAVGGENRWRKAIQHLAEQGLITDDPKDIGGLIRAVREDVEEEASDWIKEQLWKHQRNQILAWSTKGLAEWYKALLLDRQKFHEASENGLIT